MDQPSKAGIPVTFVINGHHHQLAIPPWITLLDLLREHPQLTFYSQPPLRYGDFIASFELVLEHFGRKRSMS